MIDISIALPHQVLYKEANEYCAEKYKLCGILRGETFKRGPDIFFVAKIDNKIVGTVGCFEKQSNTLPLEEVFDFTAPDNSLELGRFCLEAGFKPQIHLAIARLLFLACAENYRVSEKHFYMETHRPVLTLYRRAKHMHILKKVSDTIMFDKIPSESIDFYTKRNPGVWEVDMQAIA